MNIYCETNFFLELVFEQEQSKYCKKIISLCRKKKANLILPAYSFAEALYRLEEQRKKRENFQKELNSHLTQLTRTSQYISQVKNFQSLDIFLTQNIEEDRNRFETQRKILSKIAEIIPFGGESIQEARKVESKFNLTLQDAIIFSSILKHLQNKQPSQSCFLNRNAKDFSTTDIKTNLNKLNCKYIPSFKDGFNFITSKIK